MQIIRYLKKTYSVNNTTTNKQLKLLLNLPLNSKIYLNNKEFIKGEIQEINENKEKLIELTIELEGEELEGEIDYLKIISVSTYIDYIVLYNNYNKLKYKEKEINYRIPLLSLLFINNLISCTITPNIIFYSLKEEKIIKIINKNIEDFIDISNIKTDIFDSLKIKENEEIKIENIFFDKKFNKKYILKENILNKKQIILLKIISNGIFLKLNFYKLNSKKIGLKDNLIEYNFINNKLILVYDTYLSILTKEGLLIKKLKELKRLKNIKRLKEGFLISNEEKCFIYLFNEKINSLKQLNSSLIKFREIKQINENIIILIKNSLFLINKNYEIKLLIKEEGRISYFDCLNNKLIYSINNILYKIDIIYNP